MIESTIFPLWIQLVAANICTSITTDASMKQFNSMKRGLPYNNPSTWIQNFKGSKVSWAYNWDSATDSAFPAEFEFIPMLWGNGSDHTAQVISSSILLNWLIEFQANF